MSSAASSTWASRSWNTSGRIWKKLEEKDLMVEVDRTVLPHEGRGRPELPDPNDRATQEEEFSLELSTARP